MLIIRLRFSIVMAEIHQLIVREGIDAARRQATSRHERGVIEAAYQVLSEDAEKMGFTYSGFALTSLPHKPPDGLVWRREGHQVTMLLESGRDRQGNAVGLPYGSHARFILLFLQSEAVRSKSREIELGRSMKAWSDLMGLSLGSKNLSIGRRAVPSNLDRRLQFFADRQGQELMSHGGFVDGSISMTGVLGDQPSLWQDKVVLNEAFYRALREHPVPLSESALRAIGPRSMVIDVYIWLAYRLHSLRRATDIGWAALYAQFGSGFARLRAFRQHFIESLELAIAVYPDANVSVEERGITIRPSRSAIAKVG